MRWIAVTTRIPKPKKWPSRAYIVANTKAISITGKVWIEEETHPSWWNFKDSRGREHDGPRITHWMPAPKAPRAVRPTER